MFLFSNRHAPSVSLIAGFSTATMTRITPFLIVITLLAASALTGCDLGKDEVSDYRVESATLLINPQSPPARVDINGVRVNDGRPESRVPLSNSPDPIATEPVRVQAGVPFDVTVWTLGGSPVTLNGLPPATRPARSVVSRLGRGVQIAVMDSAYTGIVLLVLNLHPRTDRITLTERGPAEVVVRGRDRGNSIRTGDEEIGDDGDVVYDLRFPVVVE